MSRYDAPFEDIIKRHAVTYVCELLHHDDDDIKAEASWYVPGFCRDSRYGKRLTAVACDKNVCRCLVNLSAASQEYAQHALKAVPALSAYLEAADIRLSEHVS